MSKIKSTLISGAIVLSSAVAALGAVNLVQSTEDDIIIADIQAPADIHITVAEDNITIDNTGLQIINNGTCGIEVNSIEVAGVNNWDVVDYSSDLYLEVENTKKLSMQFDGDGTTDTGQVSLTDGKWGISAGEAKDLNLAVKMPIMTEPIEDSKIAVVKYKLQILHGENGSLTGDSEIIVEDGYTLQFPTPVPDENYVFDKWVDQNGNTITDDTPIHSDMTVTAQFKLIEYSVTFKTSTGGRLTGETSLTVTRGDTINSFPTPVPSTGYVFDKWVDQNGNTVNDSTIINSDTVITAKFKKATYTITFKAGTGGRISGSTTKTVEHGSSIGTLPTVIANSGYAFTGWVDESGNTVTISTVITSKKTITAQFAKVTYGSLDSTLFTDVAQNLTGSIVFKDTLYTGSESTIDISEEQNGSVLAVVDGQDVTIYSYGGVKIKNTRFLFGWFNANSVDLRGADTSEATDMEGMFYSTPIKSINFDGFNTSNVTNMSGMFWACSVSSLDLSSFDTRNVTDMSDMFCNDYSLKSVNLTSFNTSKVTTMADMFRSCTGLTSLDLSSFDVSQKPTMQLMFNLGSWEDIPSLKTIYVADDMLQYWLDYFGEDDTRFVTK